MYYLTIDTETTNNLDDPIVYDLGGAVHDEQGAIVKTFSFVIADVFLEMPELMKEAYFVDKIPQYFEEIKSGKRTVVHFVEAKMYVERLCKLYNIEAIIAHNMRFDCNALNTTQRFLTCSKYRYFLPYGVPLWDTLKMARQILGKDKNYKQFCIKNEYVYNGSCPRYTAEIIYRYITGTADFTEAHTGLEDVLIEKEIFAYCMNKNAEVEKLCFPPRIVR